MGGKNSYLFTDCISELHHHRCLCILTINLQCQGKFNIFNVMLVEFVMGRYSPFLAIERMTECLKNTKQKKKLAKRPTSRGWPEFCSREWFLEVQIYVGWLTSWLASLENQQSIDYLQPSNDFEVNTKVGVWMGLFPLCHSWQQCVNSAVCAET